MKKRNMLFVMFLLLAMPIAHAEDSVMEAGTTPDSPLWGLDLAFEKISLAFTSDPSKRVEKRLSNAEERLAEVQVMVDENKIDPAQKAAEAREAEVVELEKEIDNNAGIPADIKAKVLENLQKHVIVLQGIQDKLTAKNVTASGISTAISRSSEAITRFQAKPVKNQTGTGGY